MNTVRIYIDESLDTARLKGLKQLVEDIPHVVDVEISEKDPHEVVVDFEPAQNMPLKMIEVLREHGFHPDILSC